MESNDKEKLTVASFFAGVGGICHSGLSSYSLT